MSLDITNLVTVQSQPLIIVKPSKKGKGSNIVKKKKKRHDLRA